ncbi:MAG TPA: uroporphyrinogen-III synthase [Acidimicrobiales bacterium]|nr:uroporphyrinogen-III synthase [Acidimicrobiales bacterium]
MSLLPLEGFRVGVTADRRAAEQGELLVRRGAEVVHAPTISTEYLGHDDAVRQATEAVISGRPHYLIATTGIGVRAWFDAAQAWGLGDDLQETLAAAQVVARGPKAAAAVQVAGLDPAMTVESERLDDIVPLLAERGLAGRTVALQHYGRRDDKLMAALAAEGATVVEVPVYRYRLPADDGRVGGLIDGACAGDVDAVTFTSAPAVAHLLDAADALGRSEALLRAFNESGVVAACIGPVCAEAARASGIAGPVAPERGRLGLLVRVLTDALQARRREVRLGSALLVVQGRAAEVDGAVVRLTASEAGVLDHLVRRPGAVVSKQTMLRGGATSERALEATVARLRRRLGPAGGALRTVRARGYCLGLD